MLHGAAAAPQSAVHESGGAAAVGAVVSPASRPIPARDQTADRASAGCVGRDRPRRTESETGLAAGYRQAVEEWSQWHELIQVVVRRVRRRGIDRDTVAELRRQFDAMKWWPSGRDAAEVMIRFIEEQAWVARVGGERLIGSTEVLESLFGEFKSLEGQQSESGLTGLMLVLGSLVSPWTPEEFQAALKAIPGKAVQTWGRRCSIRNTSG